LTLIEKGTTREDAYALVQKNAMQAWEQGTDFKQLLLKDREVMSRLKPQDIEKVFRVENFLKHGDFIFNRVFGET